MLFVLSKKNEDGPFWPRLIKASQKNQYIQVDWAKWVDEDEEVEDPNKGLGGYDPSQMQSIFYFIKTLEELQTKMMKKRVTLMIFKRNKSWKKRNKLDCTS